MRNIVGSALKVVFGLAVFASLMVLEFASYTRAVAEEVKSPIMLVSPKTAPDSTALSVKKDSGELR